MFSLRLVVLVTLAGLALTDKSPRLPLKLSIGSYGTMTCSGAAVSDNTILSSGYCIMGHYNVEVKVRPEGRTINDSGDIYFLNRFVYKTNEEPITMGNDYVLLTVDRDLDGGKGFKAPKVADDDMTVAAGDVCTTVRRSPNSPTTYYYWSELEYYDVKIIDDAHCKELFMERYTDDFICVGPNDSTAEYPNDQCQTENGAPLVCADKLFAIATCELSCYGSVCAYRKISSLRELIGQ